MRIRYIFTLLAVFPLLSPVFALDFDKPSAVATGAATNEAFIQSLTKEKLFDAVCEKAVAIKKKKYGQMRLLNNLMVSGGKLITTDEPMAPPIITGGVYEAAFFNSYGTALKSDKNCADAPYRISGGITSFIEYYIDKTPKNEHNALGNVESAKKLPKACAEKVVDYLNYADKRLEKCIP